MLTIALAMILLSIWNTVKTLQRGTIDDNDEPLSTGQSRGNRGRRVFMMTVNWLFPLFSVIMLGLVTLLAS